MKIGIKNKALFIENAAVAVAIILLSFLSISGLKLNTRLARELALKKSEHKEARSAGKRLKALQKQVQDLEQKEKTIGIRVPAHEKLPFILIRTLTAIAGEAGLKKPAFRIDETDETQAQQITQQDAPAVQGDTGALPGPKPIKLQMSFEATYQQALSFLEKINNLERVVKVEQIKIERKKEILPCQKVSLQLVTYTF